MTAVGLGQQSFQAVGPGSSLCRAKYLYDFADFCQKFHSNGSHCSVGKTTGIEAVVTGSNSSLLHFFT